MNINQNDPHRYDDIIDLPHHVSKTHKHMSNLDRAAQFAPFAALSGHEDAIIETARRTNEKLILDESELELLDRKIQIIEENLESKQLIKIMYFQPDHKKNGGSYISIEGVVKKIDEIENLLVMDSLQKISIDDIYRIDGEIFNNYEI